MSKLFSGSQIVAAVRGTVGVRTLLLRETEAAEAWIAQFDSGDRQWASLMLESLELVPTIDFEHALAKLVAVEVAAVKEGSVALFAVREVPRRVADVDHAATEPPVESRAGVAGDEAKNPPVPLESAGAQSHVPASTAPSCSYFHPTDHTARPNATGPGGAVGSEGSIAHLIRDLTKRNGNKVLDHPSIHAMKRTHCRLLLLLDDLIGSGTRAISFLQAIVANRTIKSWASLHYIKIRVLAYAATASGLARLEAERRLNGVRYERLVGRGSNQWSNAQREEIERICMTYAHRTSRRYIPLGYKKVFSTVVFEHKCPNTNPPVLWATAKKWKALFDVRPKLGFPAWPIAVDPDVREKRILAAIGQSRLAEINWQPFVAPGARLRMLVLAAVARKLYRPEAIAALVEVSIALARRLLDECARTGWVTWTYRLTAAGWRELQHARAIGIVSQDTDKQEPLTLKTGFYFPTALRGAGKPI